MSSLEHTFENYKIEPGNQKAYEAFKNMLTEKCLPFLLCFGGLGNGKTYLCEALSIALYKQGNKCPVTLWSELIRTLKRLMFRPKQGETTYDEMFENFRKREKIIIDDIGMGSGGTEWEFGELEDIINYRYREKLFTVVTTNRDLKELPERVISRFSDPEISLMVLNKGRDYRRRNG